MHITVTAQDVHKHKKNIRRYGLRGLTCFIQMTSGVRVTASLDHQTIVVGVLGEPDSLEHHQLPAYWRWDNVQAVKLVDVFYP